jgi:hypothetical protein
LQPPGEAAGEFSHQSLRRIWREGKLERGFQNGMLKVKSLCSPMGRNLPRFSCQRSVRSDSPRPLDRAIGTTQPGLNLGINENRAPPMQETPCRISISRCGERRDDALTKQAA